MRSTEAPGELGGFGNRVDGKWHAWGLRVESLQFALLSHLPTGDLGVLFFPSFLPTPHPQVPGPPFGGPSGSPKLTNPPPGGGGKAAKLPPNHVVQRW